MLYNLDWLQPGQTFPPMCEAARIERYSQNLVLFKGEDASIVNELYSETFSRISEVIDTSVISFATVFNYPKLMALKSADLVCGEYPGITGTTDAQNIELKELREATDLDSKLYASVLDECRYGDCIWRVYKDPVSNMGTFTNWDPREWFPIISEDGTKTETAHVLIWKFLDLDSGTYELHAQVHYIGYYDYTVYTVDMTGCTILAIKKAKTKVLTGLTYNAVIHCKPYSTTDSVYGYDDYTTIDSILSELLVRVAQISKILDKHADPSMTGPTSMLSTDIESGQNKFAPGRYYAVGPGEEHPAYLVWDGQLEASFKQIELLLSQLYILSEMGSALLGATDSSAGQATSGTAMRMKMVNPLSKARRLANGLTRPVKQLIASISQLGYKTLVTSDISVSWKDGLPNDPLEIIQEAKLATGATQIMPLKTAIVDYFDKTPVEAEAWISDIQDEKAANMALVIDNGTPGASGVSAESGVSGQPPRKAGAGAASGVNPKKKGGDNAVTSFSGPGR